MIGAGAFAIALGIIGYALGGWLWAIPGPIAFLAILPLLNWFVIRKAPEHWNAIYAFQAAKWTLFGILLSAMLVLKAV